MVAFSENMVKLFCVTFVSVFLSSCGGGSSGDAISEQETSLPEFTYLTPDAKAAYSGITAEAELNQSTAPVFARLLLGETYKDDLIFSRQIKGSKTRRESPLKIIQNIDEFINKITQEGSIVSNKRTYESEACYAGGTYTQDIIESEEDNTQTVKLIFSDCKFPADSVFAMLNGAAFKTIHADQYPKSQTIGYDSLNYDGQYTLTGANDYSLTADNQRSATINMNIEDDNRSSLPSSTLFENLTFTHSDNDNDILVGKVFSGDDGFITVQNSLDYNGSSSGIATPINGFIHLAGASDSQARVVPGFNDPEDFNLLLDDDRSGDFELISSQSTFYGSDYETFSTNTLPTAYIVSSKIKYVDYRTNTTQNFNLGDTVYLYNTHGTNGNLMYVHTWKIEDSPADSDVEFYVGTPAGVEPNEGEHSILDAYFVPDVPGTFKISVQVYNEVDLMRSETMVITLNVSD